MNRKLITGLVRISSLCGGVAMEVGMFFFYVV